MSESKVTSKKKKVVTSLYPSVVVIGRPNVGKSTLFNKLTGTRSAIVGDEPGITRDRHYGTVEWQGKGFELVDTGGIVPDEEAVIPSNIFKQAAIAIEHANLILWMVDARAGSTPLDEEIASLLRETGKPVLVVANKAESPKVFTAAQEFHQFGFEAVHPVSSEHGTGVGELLDDVVNRVDAPPFSEEKPKEIRVAIVGRPNVGKSSLVNRLLGEERVIVSPIAGTTRDSVDSYLEYAGENFCLVDTAGIRRKGKTKEMAEKLSVVMARKALERADIAILVIDGIEGPTALDANIAGYIQEAGASVIIAVNKWDAIEKDSTSLSRYEAQVRERFKFLEFAPIVFISALTGQRVSKLLDLAARAYQARYQRISTSQLNRFFKDNLENPRASTPSKNPVKVLYLTQSRGCPPTFVLFTSYLKNGLHFSYERYVVNRLREEFDFFAAPIRIVQRNRGE
ncbi:MAG: ribosome biogenesis GTPase Der [Blastocatellia bacterium]|nr:ribosome biogenesis GTPase Der [Blastocatellia bacterium]